MHKINYILISIIFSLISLICHGQTWQLKDTTLNNENYNVYPKPKKKCCWESVDNWLVNDTFRLYMPRDGKWIQFYYEDKNKIAKIYEIKDSILNGKWTEYFYNQQIERSGNYCNGLRCGEWTEYNDSGILLDKSNYKAGRAEGISKTFYSNGILKSVGLFSDYQRDSIWNYFHDNGALKYSLTYDDGTILNDTLKIFYENGKIDCFGQLENGLYTGIWQFFYPDSGLKYKGEFHISQYNYCGGGMPNIGSYSLKNGEWIVYYETGEILAKLDFKIVKRFRPRKSAIHDLLMDKSKLKKKKYFDKNGNRVSEKYILENNNIDLDEIKTGYNNVYTK